MQFFISADNKYNAPYSFLLSSLASSSFDMFDDFCCFFDTVPAFMLHARYQFLFYVYSRVLLDTIGVTYFTILIHDCIRLTLLFLACSNKHDRCCRHVELKKSQS